MWYQAPHICMSWVRGGGSMKHRNILAPFAAVVVLALVAAACSNNNNSGGSSSTATASGAVDCNTVQFGCVTVASGAPIKIGTLLSISGDTAALGDDSNAGVALAIDYLDGKFDGVNGQIDGHDIQVQKEDDLCA